MQQASSRTCALLTQQPTKHHPQYTCTHVHTQLTCEDYSHEDPDTEKKVSSQGTLICGQFALNQSEEHAKYLYTHTHTHTVLLFYAYVMKHLV